MNRASRTTPRLPLVGPLVALFRRVGRWLSRDEWAVQLLGLSRSSSSASDPGLVLIQVDGLSRTQLERALERRRMPFLRRLIRRQRYHVETLYSGLPSSTPAVQAELFYGVRCAVPGFSFRDHETGAIRRMFEPGSAAAVERRIDGEGRGLLGGGSSYSNIYSGGADESHFCAATFGWGGPAPRRRGIVLLVLFLAYVLSALRIAALLVIETILAFVDFLRGISLGFDLVNELVLIPARVGVSVLLRELVTIGACLDTVRGVPVIHVNFVGYDEQAHHRGPGSLFAHWSLKGIDRSIRRIWRAARRSRLREYQVWIYSDHGQEDCLAYPSLTGGSLRSTINEIVSSEAAASAGAGATEAVDRGVEYARARWIGGKRLQRAMRQPPPTPDGAGSVTIAANGPIGHVYLPRAMDAEGLEALAIRLVEEGSIPLVLRSAGDGQVDAWTPAGKFSLPDDAARVLGEDHPFLPRIAHDLVDVCHHPDAGDLIVSGWRWPEQSVSFPQQHGSHAGPGREETSAFALLPPGVEPRDEENEPLRALSLRRAALEYLGRATGE